MKNINCKITANISGYTLVEIMIVMSVFTILSTMAMNYVVSGLRVTGAEANRAAAVKNARDGIKDLSKEIRGANASERGDYALNHTDAEEFIFFCDTDDDGQTEKLRYFLDGIELKKAVYEPGALNNYLTVPATTTIASFVDNDMTDIFSYYNSDYAITGDINQIRLVKLILIINANPSNGTEYRLETDIMLRNLKSNL